MAVPKVAEALALLAVFAADDFSVDDLLHRLGEVAAAALAVDGSGVMGVFTGSDRTRYVYASLLSLTTLEQLQEANQSGPCKVAVTSRQTVVCSASDLADRWPEFAGAAESAGVRSVVAAPLISRGRCWGVLDLYWLEHTELDPGRIAEIELLAKVAASYLVIADDRFQAKLAEQQLAARLLHDPLTGLANRELIHELTYHAVMNERRRRQHRMALLFIDLDGFKEINDNRGHRAGDSVLRTVGHRMRDAVRASDTVSRLGGDEFLILCEDLPVGDGEARAGVTALAERVLTRISQPIGVDSGPPVHVTASIGIALASGQPSVAELIHDADRAMYQAKHQRAQRIVLYDQRHDASPERHRIIERQLFGALERGEMRVHYQPIVDTLTGRTAAVEALLRWEHPTSGLLAAADFIDLAISNGTIIRTGHWMVGEVLEQMRRWRDSVPNGAPGSVFVNFAPQQLIDPELSSVIAGHLDRQQIEPAALTMEITEAALADSRVQPSATNYKALGHPLAIDDFGTGYSSLARLIELPVDLLKIDRLVVARLPGDPQARALLRAVLVIAVSMGLTVIAEGVETRAQADYLTDAGCHLQQGYHHGRPQPPSTSDAF